MSLYIWTVILKTQKKEHWHERCVRWYLDEENGEDAKNWEKACFEREIKNVIKRKKWYSIGLSMFMYFGTIFIVFFGCLLFPSILTMKFYFVPNTSSLTVLDHVFFSPAFPAAKLLLVFIIALLPALYYTRGFGFSLIITALPGLVAWHYILRCCRTGKT
ncbi:MAG: hypothetical protein QFX37_00465 [Archaeoglobales archaeon]|nr:hypothetical protein [Archaeoglobales archaeon]